MFPHRHLQIVLAVLLLIGCAPANDRSSQSNRYAVKEVALRHMIREFGPPGGYTIAIGDSEYSDRLVSALSSVATPVISASQIAVDEYLRPHDP